jgi:predicted HicB family RNase H-like nuclease
MATQIHTKLPADLHRQLKVAAAQRGVSIQALVVRAIQRLLQSKGGAR